jgi:hypothetical protein
VHGPSTPVNGTSYVYKINFKHNNLISGLGCRNSPEGATSGARRLLVCYLTTSLIVTSSIRIFGFYKVIIR